MKISKFLIILLLVTTVTTGCMNFTKQDYQTGLSGKLTVLTWYGSQYTDTVKKAAKHLEEQNPNLEVIIETPIAQNIYQMIEEAAATGNLPDVFSVDSSELSLYIEKGYLSDLDPFFRADGLSMDDYYHDTLIEIASPNGFPVMIPWDVYTGQVIYRKSWFDAANISYPTSDWTWDDFVDISKRLQENNPNKYGAILPFELQTLEGLIHANGGTILSPDGKTAQGYVDSEASYEVINNVLTLIRDGIIPDFKSNERYRGINSFLENQTGIAFLSPLDIRGAVDSDDFGYVTYPLMKSGEAITPLFYSGGIGISDKSQNPDAAWAFIRLLTMENNEFSQQLPSVSKKVGEFLSPIDSIYAASLASIEYTRPHLTASLLNKSWNPAYGIYMISNFNLLMLTQSKEELREALKDFAVDFDSRMRATEEQFYQ